MTDRTHRPYLVTWWLKRRDRKLVLEWLRDEWEAHSDDKYASQLEEHNRVFIAEGIDPAGSWWFNVVMSYWQRAHVLGIDTPAGQQQLMKVAATILDCCATMTRVYGEPPVPGYPSGTIVLPPSRRAIGGEDSVPEPSPIEE